MATFDFLNTADMLRRNASALDLHDGIIGLRGMDAGKLRSVLQLGNHAYTEAGYLRRPDRPWDAHGDLGKFKVITGVERRAGEEYGPGMYAVTYADGTEDLFDGKDLLCVERPIPSPVRHYGESRTACGEPVGAADGITTEIKAITCRGCKTAVHATV